MKKLLLILLAFLTVIGICSAWFIYSLLPVGSDKTVKRFDIKPGETANQIGLNLASAHIIKNALSFRIYSQVTQSAKNIKPGSYELPSNLFIPQIINKLLEGPIEIWITLPEGLRKEEMADKFIESLHLTAKEAEDFYNQFMNLAQNEEGYLFPDTYLVAKDSTAPQIVKLLEDNFKKKVSLPVSNDTLILASIIERETKTDEERPIVAGILLKRINAGWPIQADATIQYIVGTRGNYWPTVTPQDLQIDSSYNTYLNTGLPPTPICNPGLSSLEAAAHPQASDYWYYLHDKNGVIHYAATIEEQDANIAKYLQ